MTVLDRRPARTATSLLAATALAGGLLTSTLSGAASAATTPTARDTGTACPALQVQSAGFVDVARSPFAREIDCLAGFQVTTGTSATTYSPGDTVTRAQMALFLYRLGSDTGVVWGTADAGFTDTGALPTVEQQAINALANAGVTKGTGDGHYSPAAVVRRDQMASFLNRLQAAITGSGFTTRSHYFPDIDSNVHADDIDAIASAGITTGSADGRYLPEQPVSRQQMAGFLARLLDLQVAGNRAANLYAATPCLPVRSWSADRLAGAVITAAVQLHSLDAASSMVSAGIGGLLLYGNDPSPQLAAQVARLRAAEPDGWPLLVASRRSSTSQGWARPAATPMTPRRAPHRGAPFRSATSSRSPPPSGPETAA